jgi:hypothetical protein
VTRLDLDLFVDPPIHWPAWYTPCRETARTFNPRVAAGRHPFGLELGPPESRCGSCVHLRRIKYARAYLKCEISKLTHGPATDVRAKWRGCARWEGAPP